MKRKHIEDLILAVHTDTDVKRFTKKELRAVLMHEILHMKLALAHYAEACNPQRQP